MVSATANRFLVQAALKKAQGIIEREGIIQLTLRDAAMFFGMLERPPKPKTKLRKAISSDLVNSMRSTVTSTPRIRVANGNARFSRSR